MLRSGVDANCGIIMAPKNLELEGTVKREKEMRTGNNGMKGFPVGPSFHHYLVPYPIQNLQRYGKLKILMIDQRRMQCTK